MLPNGEAFLNMQLEFGVFGAEKEALFGAIRAAGKTPVQFPFRRTTLVPLTPGLNPENGKPFCVEVEDPSTGQMVKECDPTLFEELEYSRQGPSLGENIAFTALLNKKGGIIMETLLAQGAAFQANVEAEYYAAGTAFEATVRVSYDKLFENFHAYAAFHDGFCTDIQMEAFWKNEGLCLDRRPEDCGVTVTFTDLSTGKVTTTATIDPDNAEEQQKIFQAVQRLVDDLQKDMLTPMSKALNPLDTSKPDRGFKLNAQYERQKKGMNATFTFKSPRGVNVEKTVFPVALGCVVLDKKNGSINRSLVSDCATYWAN
jgi:hypothetical protein